VLPMMQLRYFYCWLIVHDKAKLVLEASALSFFQSFNTVDWVTRRRQSAYKSVTYLSLGFSVEQVTS